MAVISYGGEKASLSLFRAGVRRGETLITPEFMEYVRAIKTGGIGPTAAELKKKKKKPLGMAYTVEPEPELKRGGLMGMNHKETLGG